MRKDLVNGTIVITGGEEVLKKSIAHIEDTTEWIGLVGDSALPGAHVFAKPVFEALVKAKRRRVKIRFITEITRDNIEDCRKVMQYSELRHLDGIKGNFGASESAYLATATVAGDEIIPRLFTKFASKSDKGTGLGLFISKNIVEAHNGKLTASNNKDGKGATLSFNIPLS